MAHAVKQEPFNARTQLQRSLEDPKAKQGAVWLPRDWRQWETRATLRLVEQRPRAGSPRRLTEAAGAMEGRPVWCRCQRYHPKQREEREEIVRPLPPVRPPALHLTLAGAGRQVSLEKVASRGRPVTSSRPEAGAGLEGDALLASFVLARCVYRSSRASLPRG